MSSPSHIAELIERLEKATAASRGLDSEIFRATQEQPGDEWQQMGRAMLWYRRSSTRRIADWQSAPAYTSSLDAAMQLVPEGWTVQLFSSPEGTWFSRLRRTSPYDLIAQDGLWFPTAAMAISHASLKSRQSQERK